MLPNAAWAGDPDPWLGRDKALHGGVSFVLGAGGYAGSALVVDRPWQRALLGSAFSLTIGAGKELADLAGYGDPSWKDFTWDIIGTAVGVGLALLLDVTLVQPGRSKPQAASTSSALAPSFGPAYGSAGWIGATSLAGGRSIHVPSSPLLWIF